MAHEPRFTTDNENGLCRWRVTPLPCDTAERSRYFRGRTIERAVALANNATLGEADIALPTVHPHTPHESFQTAKDRAVAQFEQAYLKDVLLAHTGNITKAALAAGKNRRAFWQLMQKHGIEAHSLKDFQASDLDKC